MQKQQSEVKYKTAIKKKKPVPENQITRFDNQKALVLEHRLSDKILSKVN